MVHEIEPYSIENLSIWFYFDAEIVRKDDYNADTLDLRTKVYYRDMCVDHCGCRTDEFCISSRDLPYAEEVLERYLNENYPEYEFRHIEITGYGLRS